MTELMIRPMVVADLPEADRINRIAFGTFFGLKDPAEFRGDGDAVYGRFEANPGGAFVGELGGCQVACGFVTNWKGMAILGPLTVDVDYWGSGIGRRMMAKMITYIDKHSFRLSGLFTHPQSPTHIRLYESFEFQMQQITAVMDKVVPPTSSLPDNASFFSTLDQIDRKKVLAQCRAITNQIFPALDVTSEICAIERNKFGDTAFLKSARGLEGFACLHQGTMSEAGSQQTLVKFAAIRPGNMIQTNFQELLAVCEGFAAARGTKRIVAGTNTGRSACYQIMLKNGYRTWMNGIAMLRPSDPGYNLPDVFVIDDWR